MSIDTRHGFVSRKPATIWEEGLICGNGTLGANAMSRPLDEQIIFSHERMWLPMGPPALPAEMGPRLFEVRRLIDRGLYFQASQLAFDISGQDGFLYPDPFAPAFDLHIKTECAGDISNYERSVDYRSGEAVVRWEQDGTFERRMFVSRAHGVAVIQLTAPGDVTYRLSLTPRQPSEAMDLKKVERSAERFKECVGEIEAAAADNELTYRCRFLKAYPGSVQHMLGTIRVVGDNAEIKADGDALNVSASGPVLLLANIALPCDPDDDGVATVSAPLDDAPTNYQSLLDAHTKLHGELFNRVSLDIGGGDDHDRPTEELLEKSTNEALNMALVEKEFDAGRHNIISCTGELPPALQGIWGGTSIADWAGDFTHNGNVPSAIAAQLMGNTPELMKAYTSYMEYIVPYLEINAQRMFNARGIVLPSRSSTHGFNNALAPRFAGGFWIAGAAWAAHFFYDYYLYTGDEDFLANHALPFMEKAAVFFEDFLYEGPDGKYIFSPTQSPENTPLNANSQASFNATMDVAAARELLENIIEASNILGVNGDRTPVWHEMLTKLPDYMVNDEGIVKEWLTPKLDNNDNHRHSSHLYALYDGMSRNIAESPELQEAFRKTIRSKLEKHWTDNTSGFMSFGVVQLGQAAASLGDGELAYECLKPLVNRYWLNNLASMHNHKTLFNMDISGGMPAVIMKMLVTSGPGWILLLPALPSAWPKGTIEGVLCRGQIEVKSLQWTPDSINVTLVSGIDQTIDLFVPSAMQDVTAHGNRQEVTLEAGRETSLEIKLVSSEE